MKGKELSNNIHRWFSLNSKHIRMKSIYGLNGRCTRICLVEAQWDWKEFMLNLLLFAHTCSTLGFSTSTLFHLYRWYWCNWYNVTLLLIGNWWRARVEWLNISIDHPSISCSSTVYLFILALISKGSEKKV